MSESKHEDLEEKLLLKLLNRIYDDEGEFKLTFFHNIKGKIDNIKIKINAHVDDYYYTIIVEKNNTQYKNYIFSGKIHRLIESLFEKFESQKSESEQQERLIVLQEIMKKFK